MRPGLLRLYLIRHGQTAWNKENRLQGYSDVPLNDRGRAQAEALGLRLKDVPFKRLYCSDLSRAFETARLVAMERVEVTADPRLRELNQGELEGLAIPDLLKREGSFLSRWLADPSAVRLPGGETLEECQARVIQAIHAIATAHSEGGSVGIVAHNLSLKTFLCYILGAPLGRCLRFRQGEAALNIVTFDGKEWHIELVNDVSHIL